MSSQGEKAWMQKLVVLLYNTGLKVGIQSQPASTIPQLLERLQWSMSHLFKPNESAKNFGIYNAQLVKGNLGYKSTWIV